MHLLWVCSGTIGFLLCAKEGPSVNFLTPVNPIEKLEGATEGARELRFYNSEVCAVNHSNGFLLFLYWCQVKQ
jgi:hypothetical protein